MSKDYYSQYLNLLPYATPRQKEIVEALVKYKTKANVAKKLKCSKSNVENTLLRLKKKALKANYDPSMGFIDPKVYGTTTLQKGGPDDDFVMRWTKAKIGKEAHFQNILELLESFTYSPAPKIKKPNKKVDDELLTLYTITDFHLGMYTDTEEVDDTWNTMIAGKVLLNAIQDMMNQSPDACIGVLNIQGDFLHFDGLDPVTPMHKNVLDADTRYCRLVETSMDLMVWVIEMLLKKHDQVKVVICEGNHDLAGSLWLRKFLKKMMANNSRVTVNDTNIPFYGELHGNIMIGLHHGHKVNNKLLPALFSAEPNFRAMWGKATYTYIHVGHYHHAEQTMSESGGAIVERHPTLAARDAYAVRGGYMAMRGARAITYHKEIGEINRVTVLPRQ